MVPIRYNIRSLAVRKTTTFATALGIALVVCVLATSLMLSAGIKKTLSTSGSDDIALVMRKGSDNELSSSLETSTVGLVLSMPGAKKDGVNGVGEVIVVAAMEKLGTSGVTNVQIRGVTDNVMQFRPATKIVAGRAARPGSDEVVIGTRLRGRFRGLDLDQTFDLKKGRPGKVVGIFEDGGSSYESEVWADIDTLRAAFGREGGVSSVRVKLQSAAQFDAFQLAVEQDKRLGLQTLRESKYYEKQSEGTSIFIGALGTMVAFFFSAGAMIGAMITMYAAVANRQREIGTLRALGFSRSSILVSFLFESIVLAVGGGVVGTIASLAMGTVKFSMMNQASWSEIVFSFDPTPRIMATALASALLMGLVGGFFPALRASRVSPIAAMRG